MSLEKPIGGDAVFTLNQFLNGALGRYDYGSAKMLTLSRTESSMCTMFLLLDLDTRRAHQLHDFNDAQLTRPAAAFFVAGNVNGGGEVDVAIESARPDIKHTRFSNLPVPADGAGG
jgi:hypothetical protein